MRLFLVDYVRARLLPFVLCTYFVQLLSVVHPHLEREPITITVYSTCIVLYFDLLYYYVVVSSDLRSKVPYDVFQDLRDTYIAQIIRYCTSRERPKILNYNLYI